MLLLLISPEGIPSLSLFFVNLEKIFNGSSVLVVVTLISLTISDRLSSKFL